MRIWCIFCRRSDLKCKHYKRKTIFHVVVLHNAYVLRSFNVCVSWWMWLYVFEKSVSNVDGFNFCNIIISAEYLLIQRIFGVDIEDLVVFSVPESIRYSPNLMHITLGLLQSIVTCNHTLSKTFGFFFFCIHNWVGKKQPFTFSLKPAIRQFV